MGDRATVLLLIPHLEGGGAERVIEHLARGFDGSKYRLHLGVVTHPAPVNTSFPPHLTVHWLQARRVRWSSWRLLRLIHRIEPDVIVSGIAHLSWMLLLLQPLLPRGARVVARHNGSLRLGDADRWSRAFCRWLYPVADAVACQSQAMAEEVSGITGGGAVMRILPNPVDANPVETDREETVAQRGAGPCLLAVGRLAPEKGFDILLHAFALVLEGYPAARLTVVGEGPDRTSLQRQAIRLGIGQSVDLRGWVDDPRDYFPQATLFVLSSRHDALPNALLEAAGAGLPIVTTRASEGLGQLVEGQRGVWIAHQNTPEGLSRALLAAIAEVAPGQRFPHPWIEPFRMTNALRDWENFIDEILTRSRRHRTLAHQDRRLEIPR